jgi:hypothetical protein
MPKDNAASSCVAGLCGELSQRMASYWQRRNRLFMERVGLRAELQIYNSLNIGELDLSFELWLN